MNKILILIALFVSLTSCELKYIEDVRFKVTDKEIVVSRGVSKYLIFTEYEVFQNTDFIYTGKFNSSDYYRQLEIGKIYDATVIGFRIPYLSTYRNIIKIKGW